MPALNGVESATAQLAAQTGSTDILNATAVLGTAVYALSGELCQVEQHRVSARFTPYVNAMLLGGTANFSLDVTNRGSLATTYAITVTGLPGGALFQNATIAPGATISLPLAPAPANLGVYDLAATITPLAAGLTLDLSAQAAARLNVVDRFVQVTQVTPDPPFVDTGGSATNIAATVADLAGIAQFTNARTAIVGPDGATRFSGDTPLTVLAGNPRGYPLAQVNTSGWDAAIYTVTVSLLDGAGALIPNGFGYAYLSVGQGLEIQQVVAPAIVPPGTVDVTTLFTTTLAGVPDNPGRTSIYAQAPAAPNTARATSVLAQLATVPAVPVASQAAAVTPAAVLGAALAPLAAADATENSASSIFMPLLAGNAAVSGAAGANEQPAPSARPRRANSAAFTRLEEADPAFSYTGTWTSVTLARASGGSHRRSNTANNTAQLSFTGNWISLGFVGYDRGGYAELLIDGSSRGIVDLYHNQETPISFRYAGLSNGPHTLTVRVLGSGNPFASQFHVQLDYADYGDGSALPNGLFEQSDDRVILSNGWSTTNYPGASGGNYVNSTNATAWFPFSGDSFSLQALAYSSAGKTQLCCGRSLSGYHRPLPPSLCQRRVTRTFAYTGLGAGPHVLQVTAYQDATAIDGFAAPGQAPFINPNPPVSGITRFEADDPTIRYNGTPFTGTAQSWGRIDNINATLASAGEYHFSSTLSDAISFAFTGSWLGVGFVTEARGGQAAIAIDGQLVQTVDIYTRYDDTAYFTFKGLSNGAHTVTITVLSHTRPQRQRQPRPVRLRRRLGWPAAGHRDLPGGR